MASKVHLLIILFCRLESATAAEDVIHKLNGRVISNWTPPGKKLTVTLASSDDQLSLSEKKIQAIIARHADAIASPLDRKTNTLSQAPRFSSPLSRYNDSQNILNPLNNLPPTTARVTTYPSQKPNTSSTSAHPQNYVIKLPQQKEPIFVESRAPNMTGSSHKVPNNTPAASKSHSSNLSGQSSPHPHYTVQLPTTTLPQTREDVIKLKTAVEDGGNTHEANPGEKIATAETIPAPQFSMPSPSLFKHAPKSAPLRIRPPPQAMANGNQGQVTMSSESPENQLGPRSTLHASAPVLHLQTPELGRDHGQEQHELSPTTTLGTASPATLGGPFTPSISVAAFSPDHHATTLSRKLPPADTGASAIEDTVDDRDRSRKVFEAVMEEHGEAYGGDRRDQTIGL
ncbi:hypothetical protein DL93DRAFT_2088102 [Clavulina sp. PMI_390]|nr:hypothetical protein DL93DRAFT_2088102 [Clavulina sp. PMI_390]